MPSVALPWPTAGTVHDKLACLPDAGDVLQNYAEALWVHLPPDGQLF